MSKTLVVDDEISGFLTKIILGLEGYTSEIYLAEYVEVALQLLEREQFSLIITELETRHLANCEFLDALGTSVRTGLCLLLLFFPIHWKPWIRSKLPATPW